MSVRSRLLIVVFKLHVFTDFLSLWSFHQLKRGVKMSCDSVKFCFMDIEALSLSTYIFHIF